MANTIVFGETGAGKTTYAVQEDMLPHFRDGGIIVTDVALNRDRWVQEFGEKAVSERLFLFEEPDPMDPTDLSPFQDISTFRKFLEMKDAKGRAPYFFIDEAQGKFPAGMKAETNPDGTRKDTFPNQILLLFTRQRHYLSSFYLICTNPFNVWANLRKECHEAIYIENAQLTGFTKSYKRKIWGKGSRIPRNYSAETEKGEEPNPVPKGYDPVTWEFFKSQTQADGHDGGGRILEGRYSRKKVLWKRWPVIAMLAAIPTIAYFTHDLLTRDRGAQVREAIKLPPKPREGTQQPSGSLTPANPSDLPSELQNAPETAIQDLDAVKTDNEWQDSRFYVGDPRLWRYNEDTPGAEFLDIPVNVYNAKWQVVAWNLPAGQVAAAMGAVAIYPDECTVQFTKGEQIVHTLTRPGCRTVATLRSAEQARQQAAAEIRRAADERKALARANEQKPGEDGAVLQPERDDRVRGYRSSGGSNLDTFNRGPG